MDLLNQLIQEHRQVENLLRQLGLAQAGEREALLGEINQALSIHMDVEEREVYPLVAEHLGDDRAVAVEAEHAVARDALAAATDAVNDRGFDAALIRLRLAIQEHVAGEEAGIFPVLRQRAAEDLAALGDAEEVEAMVEAEVLEDEEGAR